MARFELAIDYLMASEGGYQNNPADTGNWYQGQNLGTKYGITPAKAREYGYTGEMRDLTKDFAESIYKAEYWFFDDVASQAIATKLLDMSANFGPKVTVMIAQQAVNDVVDPPVAVDGVWGPDTLDAINTADQTALMGAIATKTADRYKAIVASNPAKAEFLSGWLARAAKNPAITGGVSLTALAVVGVGAWFLLGGKR